MQIHFKAFLSTMDDNQALPKTTSPNYRFLFEIYYTTVCHDSSRVDEQNAELNRVYPGLVDVFKQTLKQPLMVAKKNPPGNDLRDPIKILRNRLHALMISKPQAAPVEDPLMPVVTLMFTEARPLQELQETQDIEHDFREKKDKGVCPLLFK